MKLTKRQVQILELLIEGFEYKEIAQKLGIQHKTVKQQILEAVHVNKYRNRLQMAILYDREKRVSVPLQNG
jgi:DNA-binding NarL/FixJ family response regulator